MDHVERPAAQPGSSPLDDATRELVEEDGESRRTYLRESWLAAAMATLYRARWGSGLTQAELAQRLGTTQSSIARLERSDDTTLGRFWEYLYACDVTPAEIETVPMADFARYVYHQPSADRGALALSQWTRTPRENDGLAQTATTFGHKAYQWHDVLRQSIFDLVNTINVDLESLRESIHITFTRTLAAEANAPSISTPVTGTSNTLPSQTLPIPTKQSGSLDSDWSTVQPAGSRPRAANDQMLVAA